MGFFELEWARQGLGQETSDFKSVADLPGMGQKLALIGLHLLGWRLRFKDLPGAHGIIIVYPHTSNWDFVIGILAKLALGIPLRFLGKSSLFEGWGGFFLGRLMRALGGEPVERGTSTGAIKRLAERMHAADWYWLALAPEGTRSYKPHWRSGFYHLALAAQLPVGCAFIDYGRKQVGMLDYLSLSGQPTQDLQALRQLYAGRRAYKPELAAPIAFQSDQSA